MLPPCHRACATIAPRFGLRMVANDTGQRAAGGREFLRGVSLLAEARVHQLRRTGRADRDHAHGARRAPPLDQREAFLARAELLHAAARSRGAAARDLHRLAHAPHVGRHRRGRAVRAAVAVHSYCALVGVRALRRRARRRRDLFRAQAGRDGPRAARRASRRHARAQERVDVGDCRGRVRRDLRVRRAVPGHRARRCDRRLARRAPLAQRVRARRRAQRREGRLRPRADRRRHAVASARAVLALARRAHRDRGARDVGRCVCGARRRVRRGIDARRDGLVLHEGRAADVRRRVRRVAVRVSGRRRDARLAQRAADDRRSRARRDDAGAADHGRRVRGLRRRLAAAGGRARRIVPRRGARRGRRDVLHVLAVVRVHLPRRAARRGHARQARIHGAAVRDHGRGRRRDPEPRAVLRVARAVAAGIRGPVRMGRRPPLRSWRSWRCFASRSTC